MTQSHGTQDLNGGRVSDERLAEMLAYTPTHDEDRATRVWYRDLRLILTELQALRSEPSEPVAWLHDEIERLRPQYQSNSMLDVGRRQLLDHFAALSIRQGGVEALDPDMPAQELRLHMGEMSAQEMRTARAAIIWANSRAAARIIAVEAERDAAFNRHIGDLAAARGEVSALEARNAVLEAALIKADLALCDWLNTYAPDLCSPVRVAEAEERIGSMGTIAYVAGTLQFIRAALTQEPS